MIGLKFNSSCNALFVWLKKFIYVEHVTINTTTMQNVLFC